MPRLICTALLACAALLGLALTGCSGQIDNTGSGPDGGGANGEQDGSALFPDGSGGTPPQQCKAGVTTKCGSGCCTKDQICLQETCKDLGPECDELWPCGPGYFCSEELGRCVPGKHCTYKPPTGVFSPKVEWEWTGSSTAPSHNQVMMAPMVANLTDDNADGKIDRDDVPDIVFNTFAGSDYWGNGVLRAISGDGKQEIFAVTSPAYATTPGAGVAIADLDNDGKPEIVTCTASNYSSGLIGRVIAFTNTGALKWKSTDPKVHCGFAAPSIADLDGDGKPEVIVRYAALEGASGKTRWVGKAVSGSYTIADYSTVADIDEDGRPEVVGGNVVLTHDGKVKWEHPTRPDGYPAIADLDGDGDPEIVTASSSDHALRAFHHDGKLYWGPVDINQGQANLSDNCQGCGGGPPTIADFDGDGKPEIAAAAGYGYVVFEHDGKAKWFSKTQDLSSRVTGSSVFDFEGDGKAEVVYADELVLRIYEGATGKVHFNHCNTSGTLWEYPVIVDVDNDGHAEIVVGHNNYAFNKCGSGAASKTGIRVLADAQNNWVRTRRIWNQHTYHVTNIDEDGRVPKQEARNWDNPALNNFRQNVQPGGLFNAPDLSGEVGTLIDDKPQCAAAIIAAVKVKNSGAAKVAPGVGVTLYGNLTGGAPQALQTVQTKTTIKPGQAEKVKFSVATPKAFVGKVIELRAMIDDAGAGKGLVNECDETNNKVDLGQTIQCKTLE
jgi:hypothetical protein